METPNKPEQAYFVTKEGIEHLEEFKRDQAKEGEMDVEKDGG